MPTTRRPFVDFRTIRAQITMEQALELLSTHPSFQLTFPELTQRDTTQHPRLCICFAFSISENRQLQVHYIPLRQSKCDWINSPVALIRTNPTCPCSFRRTLKKYSPPPRNVPSTTSDLVFSVEAISLDFTFDTVPSLKCCAI